MKKLSLLLSVVSIALIQSCKKLERIDPPCPTISNLNHGAAKFGDTVSINGANFIAGKPGLYKVSIGNKDVSVIDVTANTLRFKVPKDVGDGLVSISVGGGVCNSGISQNFIYQFTVTEVNVLVGGFNLPAGMDVDSATGNIILADKNNHVIKQITPVGQVSLLAGVNGMPGATDNDVATIVKFYAPDDVAIDPAGNIYVADDFNHCIRKIANNTHNVSTTVGTIGSSGDIGTTPANSKFTRPRGVAVNGTNNIFVIENNKQRLSYFNFTNNTAATLIGDGISSALNLPVRVAYSEKRDPAFPILVADKNNKRILAVNINRMTGTPIPLLFQPYDLAIDKTGNIMVLNRSGGRVSVIYKDNSVLDIAGTGINITLPSPSGIAIDKENKIIYVSDDNLNSIIRVKYE